MTQMTVKPITGYELAKLVGTIPKDVLSRAERSVLRAMADHYPNIWPRVAVLGGEAGYSETICRRALRQLEKRKLIALKEGSNRKGGRHPAAYIIDVSAVMLLAADKNEPSQ